MDAPEVKVFPPGTVDKKTGLPLTMLVDGQRIEDVDFSYNAVVGDVGIRRYVSTVVRNIFGQKVHS